jgi:hypothetical protein
MKIIERNNGNINFLKGFVLFLIFVLNFISLTTLAGQVSPVPAYWRWGATGATNPNISHVYDTFEQIRDKTIAEVTAYQPTYEVRWEPRGDNNLYTHQYNPTSGLLVFEQQNRLDDEYRIRSQQYFHYVPICPDGYKKVALSGLPHFERWSCQVLSSAAYNPEKNPKSCPTEGLIGNPINLSLGAKYQSETDYLSGPASSLQFTRQYINRDLGQRAPVIGRNWWHNYDRRIVAAES